MAELTVLAVDLGAESGRVMAAKFDGGRLRLTELHRFPNRTVQVRGTLYWDFLGLWREIQLGIEKGKRASPASIGVDTWGVDFGLLDARGDLVGNPVHYRDRRTEGMMEKVFARVPKAEVFQQTGIQFMPINTLYQLMSLVEGRSPQLEVAATFLTAPDLFNYWLTGTKVCEFTNATTTQLYNPRSGAWASEMMTTLGIPVEIFPPVVQPGTRLGEYEGIPVTAPACHDTGSAVAAVPARSSEYAYISSGTWSLVGLEVDEPVINAAAKEANLTNEGGIAGRYRLLKNVMGLWILQQCREAWEKSGQAYSYGEMIGLARQAPPLRSLVDVNDPVFLPPGDHPRILCDYCARTGQPIPRNHGEIVRAVLESLALAYREVLDLLLDVSGREATTVHIVGGGSRNELLNQMTADATGRPVLAGPAEATVLGNALVQLIALGELGDLDEARQLVGRMGDLPGIEPADPTPWDGAYQRFLAL